MWTLLRAPPAPRTPWAVRRRPSLPGPERVSWLAPTPSCPLSSSPQWTSPQLRLSPRMSTSSSSVSAHPSRVQVLLGTHRCPLGRPAASGPRGACCVLPSTWQSDRADHGAGLTRRTFLPHRGRPPGPSGQAQAVAPPIGHHTSLLIAGLPLPERAPFRVWALGCFADAALHSALVRVQPGKSPGWHVRLPAQRPLPRCPGAPVALHMSSPHRGVARPTRHLLR